MRLENKVAIITGGSTGIGLAITKAYLKEGARVAMAAYSENELDDAVKELSKDYEGKVIGVRCDVKSLDDVKNVVDTTFKKFGRIDVLINNAGITNSKSTEDVTDEEFLNMFDVNTFGPFRFMREVIPYMKENGGSIINTSSMVGSYGAPHQAAYSASKFAINGLTKACSKELGRFGIRVNAVAPGAVMTNMVRESTTDEQKAMLSKLCPLGRISNPEELAGAYVYLGSDESSFTNGTIIAIDGGTVM